MKKRLLVGFVSLWALLSLVFCCAAPESGNVPFSWLLYELCALTSLFCALKVGERVIEREED